MKKLLLLSTIFFALILVKSSYGQELVWASQIGGADAERMEDFKIDKDNNYYITGWFVKEALFGTGSDQDTLTTLDYTQHAFVAKYDSKGKYIWAKSIGKMSQYNTCYGESILIEDDHIWVCGNFDGKLTINNDNILQSNGTQDCFFVKYSLAGEFKEVVHTGGTGWEVSKDMIKASDGNVIVGGQFLRKDCVFGLGSYAVTLQPLGVDVSPYSGDNYVAKYTPDFKKLLWIKQFGGPEYDAFGGMDLDSNGDIVVSGTVEKEFDCENTKINGLGKDDICVAKFSQKGELIWAKVVGGEGVDQGHGIACGSDDDIYLTGSFDGKLTIGTKEFLGAGKDIFVSKFNKLGELLWCNTAGGSGREQAYGLALDTDDGPVITGWFNGSADFGNISLTDGTFENIFLAKYTKDGNISFAKKEIGIGNSLGKFVKIASDGEILLGGRFNDTIRFENGSEFTENTDYYDLFVAKYIIAPTVYEQPMNTLSCEVNGCFFSFGASKQVSATVVQVIDNTNFKWQVDKGAGFSDIVDGVNYSNSETNILSIKQCAFEMNTYKFKCVISHEENLYTPIETQEATLNVSKLIEAYAGDDIKIENSITSVQLNATNASEGTGNWTVITGNGVFSDATQYNCIVSNLTDKMKNTLQWEVTNGACKSKDEIDIFVNFVGVNSLTSSNIKVYPNPVLDKLNIETDKDAYVELFSIIGVKKAEYNVTSDAISIDVSELDRGVYILKIKSGNKVSSHKFYKE